jgi:aspartate carbamoyltransferase regulatory subunit
MPRSSTKKKASKKGSSSPSYEKFVSQLKHYEVVDMDEDGIWATLRCPKKDCAEEFKVKRKEFKESKTSIGRSCPYCFRTNIVPGVEITSAGLNPGTR